MKTVLQDVIAEAKEVGLHYVNDGTPGMSRIKHGNFFSYYHADGKKVTEKAVIERITSLGIPPAYHDVWTCEDPLGHLQSTGLDDKGRKQYRYHPLWSEARAEAKYSHVVEFGYALPHVRRHVDADIRKRGLPREKVLASLVQLLDKTLIRVGNEEYARTNKSYGLTTLRTKHAKVSGFKMTFSFKGKSGTYHEIRLRDKKLAAIIKKLQDLPGQELFQYVDSDGMTRSISSGDVNAYLKKITGKDITAKDFRTWNATVYMACSLAQVDVPQAQSEIKRVISDNVKSVAKRLGNTPAICRKSYIHPKIIGSYVEGTFKLGLLRSQKQSSTGLLPEEKAVLRFLES